MARAVFASIKPWQVFAAAVIGVQKLRAKNATKPQQEAQRELQRERQRALARELVTILRQNPAAANSFEYDRLVDAIDHYDRGDLTPSNGPNL